MTFGAAEREGLDAIFKIGDLFNVSARGVGKAHSLFARVPAQLG